MAEQIPPVNKGAVEVAQVAAGVGTALAALWFPPAALAAPVITLLLDRYTKRPERILLERVRANGIDVLSDDQVVEFVPMAYRLFEAAKQGEYDHNLRLLSEYIANELKQAPPDAGNMLQISRKIEGLSGVEIRVISLAEATMREMNAAPSQEAFFVGQAFVAATSLSERDGGAHGLNRYEIANALSDLTSRGLLRPDGASRMGKAEELYLSTRSFWDLIEKARAMI